VLLLLHIVAVFLPLLLLFVLLVFLSLLLRRP
jgi:hypothetical protein